MNQDQQSQTPSRPAVKWQSKNISINFSTIKQNFIHAFIGFGLILFWIAIIGTVFYIAIKVWFIASPYITNINLIFIIPGVIVVSFLWHVSFRFALDLLETHGIHLTGWSRFLIYPPAIPLMLALFVYDLFSSLGANVKSKLLISAGFALSMAWLGSLIYHLFIR